MKKIVKIAFSALFVSCAIYGGVKGYGAFCHTQDMGGVLLENVEALTDGDQPKEICTRMATSAPCYEYVFMGYEPGTTKPIYTYMETHRRITSVVEYVPNGVEECRHDKVTDC